MNYIIYGSTYGFYDIAYKDIMALPNVSYNRNIEPSNRLLRFIFRLHFSPRINKIIKLPFKSIWFNILKPDVKNRGEGYCFLFFSRWLEMDIYKTYLEFLQEQYPLAHYVCYFQDIVATHNIDIDYVKGKFNLILSYDIGDAKVYNFVYYPTPISHVPIEMNSEYKSDVYFLGKAKDRLDTIIKLYDQLEAKGLDCKFFIVKELKSNMPQRKGLQYIKPISYMENLRYVRNTKCLLEIMQGGAIGITPRTWEAIMYDKHLITNNQFLLETDYYIKDCVTIISNSGLGDKFQANDIEQGYNSDRLKDSLSPVNLLNFIEDQL